MARRDIGGAIAMRKSGLSEADADELFLTPAEATTQFALGPVIAPTLEGTWVAYAAATEPGYFKSADGLVYLQGAVKSGVIGTTIFTLPVGYRPSIDTYAVSYSISTAEARFEISAATGAVRHASGSTAISSLSIPPFRAAAA